MSKGRRRRVLRKVGARFAPFGSVEFMIAVPVELLEESQCCRRDCNGGGRDRCDGLGLRVQRGGPGKKETGAKGVREKFHAVA